ncbi:cytochrome P450 [Mycena pura]|uniref:Cytochrome P450 n=1 Tax=Mycena pura TaxID=153505 RepID=A0AAD6YR48_9AGAR|nr:cytochrome P450 [Mycena pura]
MTVSILDFIVCAAALALLALVYRYERTPRDSTPSVKGNLVSLGPGYAFYARRAPFLDECRIRYGSSFKFAIGLWNNMHIISSPSDLKSFFFNPRLDQKELHFRAMVALGSAGDRDLLTIIHEHFLPSFARKLSRRSVAEEITTPLYTELRRRLEKIPPRAQHRLSDLTAETLYDTLSRLSFGPSFPRDTFADFVVLDRGVNALMGPFAFAARPAKRARARLLAVMEAYIVQTADRVDESDALVASALQSIRALRVPLREKAVCLLSLLWGIHSNLLKSVWWLTACLARDADARRLLAHEMSATDTGAGKAGATRDPYAIFDGFPLLDAAITETLRLCTLPGSVRVPVADGALEVPLHDGGRFYARAGDMIMADIRQQHLSDAVYPDAATFKFDRFYRAPDVPKILSWGFGPHMCKGKVFAHHVMKVWALALLQTYDFSTADALPALAPESANVVADPAGDISVALRRR